VIWINSESALLVYNNFVNSNNNLQATSMCIKIADYNELDSVKALMDMSLDALIADTFAMEMDEISPELELRSDLGMQAADEQKLSNDIAEYFDGFQVNMEKAVTIADLHTMIVAHEFNELTDK
jgi:hypothetical protein